MSNSSVQKNLEYYSGKTILITGANAYIGPKLATVLNDVDCKLILHGHQKPQIDMARSQAQITLTQGDISAAGFWERAVKGVDLIFHLAAHETRDFQPAEDLAVNAAATLQLLETCRAKSWHPKIVFASSANVVGMADKLPVDEALQDNPQTIYAIHKLASERYFAYYARQYDIPSIILRLSNVYGQGVNLSSTRRVAFNRMIEAAVTSGRLKVFSNRHCVRDYLYIDDAVAALLLAGAGEKTRDGRYFIIGNEKGYNFEEFANLVGKKIKHKTEKKTVVEFDDLTQLSSVEYRNFVADSSRFKKLTGWKSEVSLEQGVEKTVEYFLK